MKNIIASLPEAITRFTSSTSKLTLFEQWRKEDENLTTEEIDEDILEFEELEKAMNANRLANGECPVFPMT